MEDEVCRLDTSLAYHKSQSGDGTLEPFTPPSQETTTRQPNQHLSITSVISNKMCRHHLATNADDIKNSDAQEAQETTASSEETRPYIDIGLYLNNPNASFGERVTNNAKILGPHIIEAWLFKLFLHLQNDPKPTKVICEKALCDTSGTLWCAPRQFVEILRKEWPQWRGRTLPKELIKAIAHRNDKSIYDGEHLRCKATPGPTSDLVYLHIQDLPPLSALPPRQRKIALELAQGKTYNQIAHAMGISRSTVTNHANAIYSKLGISNKVQLAILCFGHTLQSLMM